MAIAATRLHRSLVGLASDNTHVYDDVLYSSPIVRLTAIDSALTPMGFYITITFQFKGLNR